MRAVSEVAVRAVSDTLPPAAPAAAPPQVASAPNHLPPVGRLPINPDLPPDEPIEPGSGPLSLRANPSARIAASEAAFDGTRPAPAVAPGGKSDFIAAARRAAQAAAQTPSNRVARAKSFEAGEPKTSSLRAKLIKRVKSLFIAASIVAVVVGSVQIVGNFYEFSKLLNPKITTAKGPDTGNRDATAPSAKPEAPTSLAANSPEPLEPLEPLEPPKLPGVTPITSLTGGNIAAVTLPLDLKPAAPNSLPLLNPPLLEPKSEVTGSIPRAPDRASASRQAAPPQPASPQTPDLLPTAIGGARLRNAAIGGDGAAAYEVAVRFAEGRGVPISLEDAARWFERAASKGVTPAQFRYASLLEKGLGVKKDLIQARRLYLAAAAKGNGKAMHNLAVLYAEGIDGKPDYGTAAQWFRKASERGIADSQYNLGVLCARGLGTEKNIAESYKWFALAATHGDRESAKKRDEVASLLDAQALAAAQQAVTTFVAEPQPEDATVVPEPPGGWDHTVTAPPQGKSRPAGPLSLGSLDVGKR
jgi:localization factor PodJL